jgi:Capsule assembly protein Wzi
MTGTKNLGLNFGAIALLVASIFIAQASWASTYVVFVPLDDPIYVQLDTLNGLGLLYTYIDEIKPISRVEAARLTLEAERSAAKSELPNALAEMLVRQLRAELADEVQWLEDNSEDNQPTTIHPLQRLEAQFIYSHGERRFWDTGGKGPNLDLQATEGTPLLPYNDGIATGAGSNEVLRWSGWAGFGSFLTGYGELEASGPFTRSLSDKSRVLPLNAELVASIGNFALSIGQEEMWWGTGHFGALSQSNNTSPFVALRGQNIHPKLLPGFLRYLGQFRYQLFFGQLDGDRFNAHPWIDGQIVSFKPLPNFEFGFTHTIDFGGRFNDNYGLTGFISKATGFNTGSLQSGNTNSRGGIYLKFDIPRWRGLQVYQEMLGEDNLTTEVPGVGRFLPFLSVSYQGGLYLPRLTRDGLTDLRFEYAILESNYSVHNTSLYWAYDGGLMGDALGPNATGVDLAAGRWLGNQRILTKLALDLFYTERAPAFFLGAHFPTNIYGAAPSKEHSAGFAFDLMIMPSEMLHKSLLATHSRVALEYVRAPNYAQGHDSVRLMLMMSVSLSMEWLKWSSR